MQPKMVGGGGNAGGGGGAGGGPSDDDELDEEGQVRVNIVAMEYELQAFKEGVAAQGDGTPSIAEFVEDVSRACEEVKDKYGFQPSSVRNQQENILMLAANIWRCARVLRLSHCMTGIASEAS